MEPKWIPVARGLTHIKEVPGKGNNSDIMYMAKKMKVWYPGDETAWCGLFVGYVLNKAGIYDKQPENILGAKQWKQYGKVLDRPVEGSILVFWRGTPKGPYGHVGFYTGETKDAYRVLGGNQGNSVKEAYISKKRLIGAYWPESVNVTGKPVILSTSGGTLSTNER